MKGASCSSLQTVRVLSQLTKPKAFPLFWCWQQKQNSSAKACVLFKSTLHTWNNVAEGLESIYSQRDLLMHGPTTWQESLYLRTGAFVTAFCSSSFSCNLSTCSSSYGILRTDHQIVSSLSLELVTLSSISVPNCLLFPLKPKATRATSIKQMDDT